MMHTAIPLESTRQIQIDALTPTEPLSFDITPIIHPQDGIHPDTSRTFWSATANALYIVRQNGVDLFGPTPDFAAKLTDCSDLVAHDRRGPIGCEAEGLAGLGLWSGADQAAIADRPSAPVAFHAVGWLPTNVRHEAWRELVLEFLDREIVGNGMIADWAIHALADDHGRWIKKPHMHAVITGRFWKGPRFGQPQPAWFQSSKQRSAVADKWQALTRDRMD